MLVFQAVSARSVYFTQVRGTLHADDSTYRLVRRALSSLGPERFDQLFSAISRVQSGSSTSLQYTSHGTCLNAEAGLCDASPGSVERFIRQVEKIRQASTSPSVSPPKPAPSSAPPVSPGSVRPRKVSSMSSVPARTSDWHPAEKEARRVLAGLDRNLPPSIWGHSILNDPPPLSMPPASIQSAFSDLESSCAPLAVKIGYFERGAELLCTRPEVEPAALAKALTALAGQLRYGVSHGIWKAPDANRHLLGILRKLENGPLSASAKAAALAGLLDMLDGYQPLAPSFSKASRALVEQADQTWAGGGEIMDISKWNSGKPPHLPPDWPCGIHALKIYENTRRELFLSYHNALCDFIPELKAALDSIYAHPGGESDLSRLPAWQRAALWIENFNNPKRDAGSLSAGQIQRQYLSFVRAAGQAIAAYERAHGPLDESLKVLMATCVSHLYFTYKPLSSMVELWRTRRADCDTSAFLTADILTASGMDPRRLEIVYAPPFAGMGLSMHAVLKVGSWYYETNPPRTNWPEGALRQHAANMNNAPLLVLGPQRLNQAGFEKDYGGYSGHLSLPLPAARLLNAALIPFDQAVVTLFRNGE